MDIQELYDKRAGLVDNARNFLDEHTDKNGCLSEEDAAISDRMFDDIKKLTQNIERYENQARIDAELSAPVGKPILNTPMATTIKTGRASEEYRQAALNTLRNKFKRVSDYLQEGDGASGGFLVPDTWDNRIIDGLQQENIMRKLGTAITTSGLHRINIAADNPAAAWIDEGAALIFSDAKFGQIILDAHKLEVGVKITNELLNDNAFDLESYIVDKFTRVLANAEEDAFLNGEATDTTKPTGLFPAAMADSDNVVTTTSTSITADDVVNLVYSLDRAYRNKAVFVMNDQIVAQIRKLKDANLGYIWQPDLQGREPDRLLGYPIYTSAYAPTAASGAGVIAFGDMSYYNIADRGNRTFNELREVFMPNDMTGFVMIERVDGVLVDRNAVRILKMK